MSWFWMILLSFLHRRSLDFLLHSSHGFDLTYLGICHTGVSQSEQRINSYPPGQNVNHFADDNFKRIFMNEEFFYFD